MMGSYGDDYSSFVHSHGKPYRRAAAWDGRNMTRRAETFGDQAMEFLKAATEMSVEFGKGCRDIVWQSLGREDSYVGRNVRKIRGPYEKICGKLRFFNEYLPEDKHPLHVWSVICFVFVLAFAGKKLESLFGC